jgi:hypothetical protein
MTKTDLEFEITTINLAPQESLLPLDTMFLFATPVIPDEAARSGRDPESSEIAI